MAVHPEGKAANSTPAPNFKGTTGLPMDDTADQLAVIAGPVPTPSGPHTTGDGFVCPAMTGQVRGGSGGASA